MSDEKPCRVFGMPSQIHFRPISSISQISGYLLMDAYGSLWFYNYFGKGLARWLSKGNHFRSLMNDKAKVLPHKESASKWTKEWVAPALPREMVLQCFAVSSEPSKQHQITDESRESFMCWFPGSSIGRPAWLLTLGSPKLQLIVIPCITIWWLAAFASRWRPRMRLWISHAWAKRSAWNLLTPDSRFYNQNHKQYTWILLTPDSRFYNQIPNPDCRTQKST